MEAKRTAPSFVNETRRDHRLMISPRRVTIPMKDDVPVFDGHNDSVQLLSPSGGSSTSSFLEGNSPGHMDLPRMQKGNVEGGLFAVFAEPAMESPSRDDRMTKTDTGFAVAPPPTLRPEYARRVTDDLLDRLIQLVDESDGRMRIVDSVSKIRTELSTGSVAVVIHFEGAAAISPSLENLDHYYERGLRSLGLVWSRSNAFATGVPFEYPSSPDTGPGLTQAGRSLVQRCNQLGIVVDLAHINEQGFWDVAEESTAPLVVSHTAVHSICPSSRNLTDEQLECVGNSRGIIGLTFDVSAVRPDGRFELETGIDTVIDHIDHIVDLVGVDHVGFGSDFDGAMVPNEIADVSGFPKLLHRLQDRGYTDEDVRKVAGGNWLRVLEETWHDTSGEEVPDKP